MSDLAVPSPHPAAPIVSDLADMGREEFIAIHRNRMFRPKGKQTYYVIPADREPYPSNALALPLMHHGKLRAGVTLNDALGALYDETYRFGRARKDEQRRREGESASAIYRAKRDAALAFYSSLDIEALAQQFADLLGRPKSDNHRDWVEDLLVAAHTGNFCDHLRIENKKSKALFGTIFGVKLPSTNKGTREMLAQRAPWPLPKG